jgi:arginine/lysine/ornithine decarboxylase
VEKALTTATDIGLVVITSPTYEGVTSDIRAIADICHRRGALLLVDEAHGAHFGFSPMFPENAVKLGADVVVMSLHKTLPSMTQTALLHICSDSVDIAKISYMLSVFETSSPSYILMSSMEKCIETLKKDGAHLFSDYEKNLTEFYGRISNLKHLAYLSGHNIDPGKIVISTLGADISGPELAGKIRDIGFEPEMAGPEHVIAMTSICDTNDALMELAQGLLEIDAGLHDSKNDFSIKFPVQSQAAMSPREAVDGISEVVPIRDAAGKIAAEYLYMYPPGCPLIVPGEVISDETLAQAEKMLRLGLHIYSSSGGYPAKLEVIGID